jgi:hypothetical protein
MEFRARPVGPSFSPQLHQGQVCFLPCDRKCVLTLCIALPCSRYAQNNKHFKRLTALTNEATNDLLDKPGIREEAEFSGGNLWLVQGENTEKATKKKLEKAAEVRLFFWLCTAIKLAKIFLAQIWCFKYRMAFMTMT